MKFSKPGRALGLIVMALLLSSSSATLLLSAEPESVKVYKSATCGCCRKWVDHLKAAGFSVTAEDVTNLVAIREQYGVPDKLKSCHTAVVGRYVVEGHVPADVVKKLLQEKPAVIGITVPGMPQGSPGMEGPNPEPYEVLTFDSKGQAKVYAVR